MPTKPNVPVTAWSFSRIHTYEECPRKFRYRVVDRLKEPDNVYQARGIEIHKLAENYVKGLIRVFPKELETFTEEFKELRKLYKNGLATVEGQMPFMQDWTPLADWFDKKTWVRIQVDARTFDPKTKVARVIDHKTGRIYDDGKEQMGLYALAEFKANLKAEVVKTELWYIDQGELVPQEFDRSQVLSLQKEWEKRAEPLFKDKVYAANPSKKCLKCHFRKANGGPCEY